MERVQRRASKFILNLPFLCYESYRERLIALELMPLSYWHEYFDLLHFCKAVTGQLKISKYILPQPLYSQRTTRSSSTGVYFRPRICKTQTYQNSFFIRVTRTWNALPVNLRTITINLWQFKSSLREYYFDALRKCYDADDPKNVENCLRKMQQCMHET